MTEPIHRMPHGIHSWETVFNTTLGCLPAHAELMVEYWQVPSQLPSSCVLHVGSYKGQREDYRASVSDGRGIHIKRYDNCFTVHWDKVDPLRDPIGHIRSDVLGLD